MLFCIIYLCAKKISSISCLCYIYNILGSNLTKMQSISLLSIATVCIWMAITETTEVDGLFFGEQVSSCLKHEECMSGKCANWTVFGCPTRSKSALNGNIYFSKGYHCNLFLKCKFGFLSVQILYI